LFLPLLKDKKQLVTEEATLRALERIVDEVSRARGDFGDVLPIDLSRLNEDKLKEL